MGGEACASLDLTRAGVVGDRRYAFESPRAPVGKPLLSSAERTSMLLRRSAVSGAGLPTVRFADAIASVADTSALGLAPDLALLHSPERPLTDVRPVSLLSLGAVRGLSAELGVEVDPRRFRANILFELFETGADVAQTEDTAWTERALVGRVLRIGSAARLRITEQTPRCRIVSLDPETAEPDRTLLPHLARFHNGRIGIYAVVVAAGAIHAGDLLLAD
jgi:uncharacterized protein YcbX